MNSGAKRDGVDEQRKAVFKFFLLKGLNYSSRSQSFLRGRCNYTLLVNEYEAKQSKVP